jgi:hypothetical protein
MGRSLISNAPLSTIAKRMNIGKLFAIAAAVAIGLVAVAGTSSMQSAQAGLALN